MYCLGPDPVVSWVCGVFTAFQPWPEAAAHPSCNAVVCVHGRGRGPLAGQLAAREEQRKKERVITEAEAYMVGGCSSTSD